MFPERETFRKYSEYQFTLGFLLQLLKKELLLPAALMTWRHSCCHTANELEAISQDASPLPLVTYQIHCSHVPASPEQPLFPVPCSKLLSFKPFSFSFLKKSWDQNTCIPSVVLEPSTSPEQSHMMLCLQPATTALSSSLHLESCSSSQGASSFCSRWSHSAGVTIERAVSSAVWMRTPLQSIPTVQPGHVTWPPQASASSPRWWDNEHLPLRAAVSMTWDYLWRVPCTVSYTREMFLFYDSLTLNQRKMQKFS